MDIEKILSELMVEEKIALVSGHDFMNTNAVPRLKIPSVKMSDGPHGLRVQTEGGDNGVTGSEPATAFPTAATTANGWNEDNLYKMGVAIATESLHYGVDVVLGPGVCIKRNPLCGRNFEYFSEDPYLSAKLGAAEVNGLQSKNIGVSVKHFALNNAENYRFIGNSVCDERAAREIYLKAFEMIIKESNPHTVMCAYNKANGEYCSENGWLLTDVLRKEWGYNGLVMSDWGATHDRVKGVKSGLDLEMPGDTAICRKWIKDAVENGELSMGELDKAVKNVLTLASRYENNVKGQEIDWEEHNSLSAEIAEDCAVLLKNDGTLPLNPNEKLLIVGDLFDKMRYQGSGSSMINPARLTTPKDAFDNAKVDYVFCRGYAENSLTPDEEFISQAVEKAKEFDKIVVFAGLTDYVESEGCDRASMRLPENQLAVINALIKTGKKIVVVLFGGSSIELPFENGVNAILDMYLPGQNGGTATFNLLFGKKSPCGKLAETWVEKYEDVPFGSEFSKSENEIYKESVFVGYRYYLTVNKPVRYPFGYGLSYTTFDYSDVSVTENEKGYSLKCTIKNTGDFDGAEIVQAYIRAPKDVFRPIKELKGFKKVYLKKGESKTVDIFIAKEDLRYYNVKEKRWVLSDGEYRFEICSDANTVKLEEIITVQGEKAEKPYSERVSAVYGKAEFDKLTDDVYEEMSNLKIPPVHKIKPITVESRLTDLKATFFGKILFKAILSVADKDMKNAKKLPEGKERDNKIKGAIFLKRILESNSLISMSMSAGEKFPYNFAEGFAHLSNGKIFKGIKCFCSKIKAPLIPTKGDK